MDLLQSLATFAWLDLFWKLSWLASSHLKLLYVVGGKILDLTVPGFVKEVKNKAYFKWYQVKFKRKQIYILSIREVIYISILSAEILRQLWSYGLGPEPWPPHCQMAFTVPWADSWQLPHLTLWSPGCHIQWCPYLLGQTWHTFPPVNQERATSVRVIGTSGQLDWSEDCQSKG